jgi:FKBP-type peptidyl-prolyl cis-trans isomerase (trigger factor)
MIKNIRNQSKDKEIDDDSIRQEYRASAIHNLRWYFLRRKLIETENITVSDDELRQMIDNSNLEEKEKRRIRNDQHYLDHLRDDLLEKRVIDLLRQHAEVTEIYPLQKKAEDKSNSGKKLIK